MHNNIMVTLFISEFVIGYVPLIDPIVVSEDAGTVEIIRVEKRGQIEQPVDITFTGGACVIIIIIIIIYFSGLRYICVCGVCVCVLAYRHKQGVLKGKGKEWKELIDDPLSLRLTTIKN